MKFALIGMSLGFIGTAVAFMSNGMANDGTVLAGVLLAHVWLIYFGVVTKAESRDAPKEQPK